MNRTKLLILILMTWLGGLSCQATPPSVCPNLNCSGSWGDNPQPAPPDYPSGPLNNDGLKDSLDSDPEEIQLPESPDPERGAVITSNAGAFSSSETVTVGVDLPSEFSGNPPLAGELTPNGLEDFLIEVVPDGNGAIAFGVYVDSGTTPGAYEFFAEQGAQRLTIEIQVNP